MPDALTQLYNTGMAELGDSSSLPDKRTIVVVGTPRSGTSLVAGSLAHLGLFMGDKAVAPVYEDHRLCKAFEGDSKTDEDPSDILHEYNEANDVWGFKRPAALHYLQTIHDTVRNPIYIVIFRDLFAIANRNKISMNTDIVTNMKRTLKEYKAIVTFLEKANPRALLVSNEKILHDKENFVHAVNSFGGLNANKTQINAALDFINPNPEQYLESSRITKAIGTLDKITPKAVAGWAKYLYHDRPAQVTLFVNDDEIMTIPAINPRADLKEKAVHPTGECGFIFHLEQPLNAGDIVRVQVQNDIRDLRNSPRTFTPAA